VATEANTSAAIPSNASSRKSIARYAWSSLKPGRCSTNTRCATHVVQASLEPGSRARWATNAKITRSAKAPRSGGRPRPGGPRRRSRGAPTAGRHPGAAQAPAVQHLDLPTGVAGHSGGDGLGRVEEPGDRGHQPGQPGPVHGLGPPEVVDHLGGRGTGVGMAFVVRQLQVAHRRPVPVPAPRLPQVHAYMKPQLCYTASETAHGRVPTRFRLPDPSAPL